MKSCEIQRGCHITWYCFDTEDAYIRTLRLSENTMPIGTISPIIASYTSSTMLEFNLYTQEFKLLKTQIGSVHDINRLRQIVSAVLGLTLNADGTISTEIATFLQLKYS